MDTPQDTPGPLLPTCPYCDEQMPGATPGERERALYAHVESCVRVKRLRTMSPCDDAPVYGETR